MNTDNHSEELAMMLMKMMTMITSKWRQIDVGKSLCAADLKEDLTINDFIGLTCVRMTFVGSIYGFD